MAGDEEYKRLVEALMKHIKKLHYGTRYIKNNQPSQDIKDRYVSIVENVHRAYTQFQTLIDNSGGTLPSLVDLNGKGPGFSLFNGILYGNVQSAKSFSEKLLAVSANDIQGLQNYTVATYISICVQDEKKIFIEIPEEVKTAVLPNLSLSSQKEEETQNKPIEFINPFDIFSACAH